MDNQYTTAVSGTVEPITLDSIRELIQEFETEFPPEDRVDLIIMTHRTYYKIMERMPVTRPKDAQNPTVPYYMGQFMGIPVRLYKTKIICQMAVQVYEAEGYKPMYVEDE